MRNQKTECQSYLYINMIMDINISFSIYAYIGFRISNIR